MAVYIPVHKPARLPWYLYYGIINIIIIIIIIIIDHTILCHIDIEGKWSYRCTHFLPPRLKGLGGQGHDPYAISRQTAPVPIAEEAG
jgi:hypothetical protein